MGIEGNDKNLKLNETTKKESMKIFTLPNFISLLRLLLVIPIFYCMHYKNDVRGTVVLLAVSAISDVADGIIARKFDCVSDLGKILDPVADKITQLVLVLCLAKKFPQIEILVNLLIKKEIITAILGLIVVTHTGKTRSAAWHGKLTTVAIFTVAVMHIIFPHMSFVASNVAIGACIIIMTASFVLYTLDSIWSLQKKQ